MGSEMERDADGGKPVEDVTNAAFWNSLAEKLRETTVFGCPSDWEAACDDGFDDGPDPEWEAREEARHQAVRRHALSRLSEDYRKQADAWLKSANVDLKAVAAELMDAAANTFTREDVEEQSRQIGEMIEVAAWYHTFIPAKLQRAVGGLLERAEKHGEYAAILAESRLLDANGSGKVALVAIERSIAAWLYLRVLLPGRESEILGLLALLDRMRRGIHAACPAPNPSAALASRVSRMGTRAKRVGKMWADQAYSSRLASGTIMDVPFSRP
jgi:hypothetical protein